MSSTTIEPIATAIGSVEIALAGPADLDDVLDILNESARWLTSRRINQWVEGFRAKNRCTDSVPAALAAFCPFSETRIELDFHYQPI
jgi:hypothetical protein